MIRFLLDNGIGQNVTASALLGIPALIWARVKVLPVARAHHQRVVELHQAIVGNRPVRDAGDRISETTTGGDW